MRPASPSRTTVGQILAAMAVADVLDECEGQDNSAHTKELWR
jgi:hypothetical protein